MEIKQMSLPIGSNIVMDSEMDLMKWTCTWTLIQEVLRVALMSTLPGCIEEAGVEVRTQ